MASETCLFTGVLLSDETKVEHTIPASIGGRIKSKSVTCDDFNQNAGNKIDHTLKLVYEPMLNALSPLLPRSFQAGKMQVDIPGEQPGVYMEAGRLSRGNLEVIKDGQGKVISLKSSNPTAIRKVAKTLGKDTQSLKLVTEFASNAPLYYKKMPVICRELELAALKAVLTTFDVLLADSAYRFTRDSACEDARKLFKQAVMEDKIDKQLMSSISLGLQYEKIGLYHRISKECEMPAYLFGHTLFVAGYPTTRCLDIVFWVFGIDPFGFRLSSQYTGESFGYVFSNPIFSESHPSGIKSFIPSDSMLCAPTERRSLPEYATEKEMRESVDLISSERRRYYTEAVKIIEMTADKHVEDCIRENASITKGADKSAIAQISSRLLRMFGRKRDDPAFVASVSSIVLEEMNNNEQLSALTDCSSASCAEMQMVIDTYRKCLSKLLESHGPLGDAFLDNVGVIPDPSNQREPGKLPPMK